MYSQDILSGKLTQWLEAHDTNLGRFRHPVSLAEVSREANEPAGDICAFLHESSKPVYHIWEHVYRGKRSRSKPYCLRLSGPAHVSLDWEDSVVGAAEADFQRRGYETRHQIGTPEHLSRLSNEPSLGSLTPGSNLRDFWALRRVGQDIDLYIVEAKGKEAGGFESYCFAEALGQIFSVSADVLSAMLGTKRRPGHGICWSAAQHLYAAWTQRGFRPTITVAVLVPEWSPDVVWSGGRPRFIEACFYARPLANFRLFLANGIPSQGSRVHKGRAAFAQMLDELEANIHIRSLAQAETGLRFRLLSTTNANAPSFFRLSEEGA